jgi:peptide/nickel transport system substrate-binding protein
MKNQVFRCCVVFWLGILIIFHAGQNLVADDSRTVTVALNVEPNTLNAMELKSEVDVIINACIFQSLMMWEYKTGEEVLGLAASINLMKNGKDLKIKLRKNVRFHDGSPLTSRDIQFSFAEAANPRNANILAAPLDEVEEIEIIDDHNLIIRFFEPYAPWKELLTLSIVPKKYYQKLGRKGFRKHPIGSGPLKFVSQSPGKVILEAVKNHPDVTVNYDRLNLITVSDAVTRASMLETGELDLIYEVLPHQVKQLQKLPHITVKFNDKVPSFYGMNVKPAFFPVLKDRKLKQAMNLGINRDEIINQVFFGYGFPMYMYAARTELGFDPDFKFEFNEEKARQLVKDSSYKPGSPLTLTYTNMLPNAAIVATIIQAYMKRIGITVKLQQLEAGVQATYTRNRDKREGHMTLYSWPGSRDPLFRLMLSVPSTSPYSSYPSRERQKELDQLVKAQQHEMDPEKRLAQLKIIHQYLNDEPSTITLFGLQQIYAMSNRIDYSWTDYVSYFVWLPNIKLKN